MKRGKSFWLSMVIVVGAVVLILLGIKENGRWQADHSAVPDAVGSFSANNYHYLTVIANSRKIEDQEAFAREIIHMCQDNSFHSLKFSTGINGYPSGLDIKVYLMREDIEKEEPVCTIRFVTEESEKDYDIKNDADKFHLYLDGEEIEFF